MFLDKAIATKLSVTKVADGKTFVIVRPGLVATYYLNAPVIEASRLIASSVSRYLEFVGPDAIRGHLAQNGTFKTLTKDRVNRDLKVFRAVVAGEPGPDLEYSSEVDGSVGAYGISVRGADNDDAVFPLSVSLLRLEFPEDTLLRIGKEQFLEFALGEAMQVKAQSGTVGWGLKRAVPFPQDATAAINALLPRYLGIDPCYNGFGRQMRGNTPSPNWISFLDEELFAACGGDRRCREVAAGAECVHSDGLVMLRSATTPMIGDQHEQAKDIGALPEVARFFALRRVAIGGLGDKKFDARAWLERFDALPARPWTEE